MDSGTEPTVPPPPAPQDPAAGDAPVEEDAAKPRRFLDMSRRGFLRTGSIGVVAAGVVGSVPGLSSLLTGAESDAPEVGSTASAASEAAPTVSGDSSAVGQTVTAHVTDLDTGAMKIFFGNTTVEVQDAGLAQRINAAAQLGAAGR